MAEFDLRNNRANQPKPKPVPQGDGMRFDFSGGKARPTSTPIRDQDIPIPVRQEPVPETYQEGKVTFLKNDRDAVDHTTPMEQDDAFTPDIDITDKKAMAQRIQAESAAMKGQPVQSVPPVRRDNEFVDLGALNKKPGERTPIIPGSPPPMTAPRPASAVKVSEKKEEIDTPKPLRIVDNMVGGTPSSEELTPFDINSLPKKKQEMGDAESEDMMRLDQAVEREMKSITQRVQAITDAQYDELMEARASGRQIARPMSDEEFAAAEQARIEAQAEKQRQEEANAVAETEIGGVKKRFIIRDENDDEEPTDISKNTEEQQKEDFIAICSDAAKYVSEKVTATNYFDRVLHGRNRLNNNGVFAEIWAIVMYNGEGEAIAHPILVARKGTNVAIIEINLTNIAGIHTLEANDTVESVYKSFQTRGALYEYIDYLTAAIVVKLPADMPTADIALKLANDKLGEKPMDPKPIENAPATTPEMPALPDADELADAINPEEAAAFNQMTGTEPAGEPVAVEPESDAITAEEPVPMEIPQQDDYNNQKYRGLTNIEVTDIRADDGTHAMVYGKCSAGSFRIPYRAFVDLYGDPESYKRKEVHAVEETRPDDAEPGEQINNDLPPAAEPAEDDGPLVISKGYDGSVMPDGFVKPDELKKDLEAELHVSSDERSDDEIIGELRDAIKKTVPSIKKRISLKEFTISDVPVSASMVAGFSVRDVNQADWVLPNAKRMVSVRGLAGPDLFSMNPQNIKKNKINTFRQIYGIIYSHITSKKPPEFDEWLKVTRFSDIDHLYAALLRATFAGSNFLHYECPDCNHVFIQDFEFEDFVKYRDDKARRKIESILNSADSSIAGYDVELSQISDNYVVGLKDPSIWNMVMETAALSDKFLEKYEDLLDTMSFIDSIYLIDHTKNTLSPIDFGYDPKDPAKSTARKITIMSDIIRTLSSDNYFDLRTQIAKMFSSSDDLSYQVPEAVCPKCGHKFAAEEIPAMQLLFMRHQLGALGAM